MRGGRRVHLAGYPGLVLDVSVALVLAGGAQPGGGVRAATQQGAPGRQAPNIEASFWRFEKVQASTIIGRNSFDTF